MAVALSRLSESYHEGSGVWTVLAFFLSPFAVFMLAGYSEAPFLALAIPAWLLARKGRWEAAAVCAAFASCVRISGLFLALGLAVMFLVARNGLRGVGWRKAPCWRCRGCRCWPTCSICGVVRETRWSGSTSRRSTGVDTRNCPGPCSRTRGSARWKTR